MKDMDKSVQPGKAASFNIEIFNPLEKEQSIEPSTSITATTTPAKPQILTRTQALNRIIDGGGDSDN